MLRTGRARVRLHRAALGSGVTASRASWTHALRARRRTQAETRSIGPRRRRRPRAAHARGAGRLRGSRTNFTSRGPELLDAATDHLWAYYRSVAAALSPAEREQRGVPTIDESGDIWEQVEIRFPPAFTLGGRRFAPARSYISFEGEVSWEIEHGLQLVVEDGRRVCKVGPYDGHVTNAHAYGDESLLGVVFRVVTTSPGPACSGSQGSDYVDLQVVGPPLYGSHRTLPLAQRSSGVSHATPTAASRSVVASFSRTPVARGARHRGRVRRRRPGRTEPTAEAARRQWGRTRRSGRSAECQWLLRR